MSDGIDIVSRNPNNGDVLQNIKPSPLSEIPNIIEQSRQSQRFWAALGIKERCTVIRNAREYILDHIEEIAELIEAENGKPKTEAIIHDILPVLELMTTYTNRAPKLLSRKRIHLRLMLHRKSYVEHWPLGVVGIISPWNFPFSIPFGEVVLALLAGNSVILKPSESTTLIGLKIAEILDNAGLPKGVFNVIVGAKEQGEALSNAGLDKIFFTGSVATGKRVLLAAASTLTPVILELGGKDPMIVLHDADIDYATSAALWGAFANSGQICASIERIIVHESIHDDFISALVDKVQKLKNNNQSLKNLGYITVEKQKEVYIKQLIEARNAGCDVIGGNFNQSNTQLEPTIVTNPKNTNSINCPIESLSVYKEETFGPIVAVTKFNTTQQAIEKANDSKYGLLATIIGKDTAVAEQMASKIEAGTVIINEVIYTHGLPETPWGGVKNSGFGVVHSDEGLLEFVHKRHVHTERFPSLTFKSPWWYPYTEKQLSTFRLMMEVLYRRSIIRKLLALPNFLYELVELLKRDKRL